MSRFRRFSWVITLGIPLFSVRALARVDEAEGSADDVAEQEVGDAEGGTTEPREAPPDGAEQAPADEPAGGDAEAETPAERELEEDQLGGEGEEPSRPPAAGKGVIWGVIKDTEFGEPLIEAPIQVLGSKTEVITDESGSFRLELPPGTYSIRVSYELHRTQRIVGLVVRAGKVQRLDIQMAPDEKATGEFEIVEEADKSSLEGILLARQRSTIVGDGIGRGEISKSTDRNAAQAAQRVVGATVVGGRFVYVRGLGERYTNALINGVPLPSPEPDRAAVPLDLFPTGVLNSLTIAKTFTPDVPGDFAGGSVRIETREIPNAPLFTVSARGAYNTNSTFRTRLSSRGGDLDWLGIDDGTRALPDDFPKNPISPSTPKAEKDAAGQMLNSYMSAQRSRTPPDWGVSLVGGNGWDLGENRKFGFVGSLSYSQSYSVRRGEILRLHQGDASDPRGFSPIRDYRATTGNVNVNWGGFASATYRFDSHHRVSLLGLRSTLSDNRTSVITGAHAGRNQDIDVTRLSFVTRALNLGMLSGEHLFPELGGAELEWSLVLSSASRDEPDRRDVVWGRGTGQVDRPYFFTEATESGRHFFAEQIEKQYGGGLDWTQPIGVRDGKLKFGGLVSVRNRNFTSRTLRFETAPRMSPPQCPPDRSIEKCTDALFVPENIGTLLTLTENTRGGDAYDASLDVYSGYVMAEVGITDALRVLIGERVEHTLQTIEPYDQFASSNLPIPEGARISQTDLLPASSVAWSATKKTKLRASVTRTLARPQLRELAPFQFVDYFGGPVTSGNPELELTRILNVDARIEHFPTLKDVLAFSLFYKDFRDPIEAVILSAGDEGSLTYRNARGAKLLGLELEARRGLDFMTDALQNFSVVTNLTVAHSRIEIDRSGTIDVTNPSRPLVNQAPWVFNLALDYGNADLGLNARLLYNVVGPRIVLAGGLGLDDVYEHPRNILDLTVQKAIGKQLSVKLEGKNLLNAAVLQTQGCGSDGLFGSTWHFGCSRRKDDATSYYTEGASFAVTGAYEF